MRIAILTPFFPPDIGGNAQYAWEASLRFSKEDIVTVITYAHHPEQIPGVNVRYSKKMHPLLIRLIWYFLILLEIYRRQDLIYIENGASVEIPCVFIQLFTNKKIVLHVSDPSALKRAGRIYRWAHNRLVASSSVVQNQLPLRPEILPFGEYPHNAFMKYESQWEEHIASVRKSCL